MRMISAISLGTLLVGVHMSNPASAETFTPAPNTNFTVDLDTRDGAFSIWQFNDLSGTNYNALRSKVTVARLGQDKKWAPGFHIELKNAESHARLRIVGIKGLLFVTSESWVGEKKVQDELFLMPPVAGETFGLDLDWGMDGSAAVVIHTKATAGLNGYEEHNIRLNGPPTSLEISSSTGELTLNPLQLGHTAP